MIIHYEKEIIKNPKKYYLNILCPISVVYRINDIFPYNNIWIMNFNSPAEAIIELNSKKALIFFSDFFEDKFYLTCCSYPERNDNCFFCGQKAYVKFKWTRFKKFIWLCSSCDSKINELINVDINVEVGN